MGDYFCKGNLFLFSNNPPTTQFQTEEHADKISRPAACVPCDCCSIIVFTTFPKTDKTVPLLLRAPIFLFVLTDF